VIKPISYTIVIPSLRLLLGHRLQKAIYLGYEILPKNDRCKAPNAIPSFSSCPFNLSDFPLHKVRDNTEVWYVSAIAFKLETLWEQSAIAVAEKIITKLNHNTGASVEKKVHPQLNQINLDKLSNLWQESSTWVEPPGWIHWRLNSMGIAIWMQMLIEQFCALEQATQTADKDMELENDNQFCSVLTSSEVFSIQYAYARCCSILRMADREDGGLRDKHHLANRSEIRSKAIPWLNSDNCLRLTHPCEQDLIAQFVLTIDTLSLLPMHLLSIQQTAMQEVEHQTPLLLLIQPSEPLESQAGYLTTLTLAQKQALTLSQCFLRFYASCQIWGDVWLHHLPLAQARLGLVTITRQILQILLQKVMNVKAPVEL